MHRAAANAGSSYAMLNIDVAAFRVESFSQENVDLRRKVDSLESNNRLVQLNCVRPASAVPQPVIMRAGCEYTTDGLMYRYM